MHAWPLGSRGFITGAHSLKDIAKVVIMRNSCRVNKY